LRQRAEPSNWKEKNDDDRSKLFRDKGRHNDPWIHDWVGNVQHAWEADLNDTRPSTYILAFFFPLLECLGSFGKFGFLDTGG
jgi:hypothetical protein